MWELFIYLLILTKWHLSYSRKWMWFFSSLWSHCAGVKTAGLCWFLTRKTDGSQIEYYDVHIEICWANTFLHKQTCPVYVCVRGGSNLFLQCFGVGARGQPSLYCILDCLNVCQPTKRVFLFLYTQKRKHASHETCWCWILLAGCNGGRREKEAQRCCSTDRMMTHDWMCLISSFFFPFPPYFAWLAAKQGVVEDWRRLCCLQIKRNFIIHGARAKTRWRGGGGTEINLGCPSICLLK